MTKGLNGNGRKQLRTLCCRRELVLRDSLVGNGLILWHYLDPLLISLFALRCVCPTANLLLVISFYFFIFAFIIFCFCLVA